MHLGWHYAVDGYVALVLVWGLWRVSGRLLTDPDADAGAAAPATVPAASPSAG